nr:lysophospholipid acyltransferase family protein [Jannaschia pohangensis]
MWDNTTKPPVRKLGPMDWVRVVLRGIILAVVTFGGLLILLLTRLIEAPIHGMQRPWTPRITMAVCKSAFVILGMRRDVRGQVMQGKGAVVANHGSWLDIFALNASKPIYFVAKDDVAKWPGIGWLARATGTVFIKRDRSDVTRQLAVFDERLRAGHKLLFFPEGTTTDSLRVIRFKPTLFGAFLTEELREYMQVQPVTVAYHPPPGVPETFYGWWGDHDFAAHLVQMLAVPGHGRVEVIYHPPLKVSDFTDRRELAQAAEDIVRAGLRDAGRHIGE